MTENEEMVYSTMGLNPILILEEPPTSENYKINIVRPGEEVAEEQESTILEKDKRKISDDSNAKQKTNNKDIVRLKDNNPIDEYLTNKEETEDIKEKDINLDLDVETNELIISDDFAINEKNVVSSSESKDVNEDPRRKRRRSSASA